MTPGYEAREGRALWQLLRRHGFVARDWDLRSLVRFSPESRRRLLWAWMAYLGRFAHRSDAVRREFVRVCSAPGMAEAMNLAVQSIPLPNWIAAAEDMEQHGDALLAAGLEAETIRAARIALNMISMMRGAK